MNNEDLNTMYNMVDSLSADERKQLIAYLSKPQREQDIRQIITQEELDLIYSTAVQNWQK
ncbi:hypothetical protein [Vibrio rhodolitus]|uniref:hypothetical protein n=1 Tax=Vibrio rhodolitus TaxID=2231649 RepID=UPI000E0BB5F0|nr:hypothetical protein [Vibrio rhodolitus]